LTTAQAQKIAYCIPYIYPHHHVIRLLTGRTRIPSQRNQQPDA
jgi:hypothetical protein